MKSSFFARKQHSAASRNLSHRVCEAETCAKPGLHQAPKKDGSSCPQQPHTWHWFCLDHVRCYNAEWNYFSQMSEAEIVESWRRDMTWERPSWPLGDWHGNLWQRSQQRLSRQKGGDPFGIFNDVPQPSYSSVSSLTVVEQQALKIMGLSYPFTLHQLQTAYRVLAKKHHPDLNQGCKKAEEMLKKINQASDLLKKCLGR